MKKLEVNLPLRDDDREDGVGSRKNTRVKRKFSQRPNPMDIFKMAFESKATRKRKTPLKAFKEKDLNEYGGR
jgi:hypothetical protein